MLAKGLMGEAPLGAEAPARLEAVLFNRLSVGLSQLILALSVVLPPEGVGVAVCWFQAISGIPCPGCGLTRSVASLTHGHFESAVQHHPFGILVWLLALVLASSPLWGQKLRWRCLGWLRTNDLVSWRSYLAAVYSFVVFGTGRALLLALERIS